MKIGSVGRLEEYGTGQIGGIGGDGGIVGYTSCTVLHCTALN